MTRYGPPQLRFAVLLLTFFIPPLSSLAQSYEAFSLFSQQNFTATSEPLVYSAFGSSLHLVDSGFWLHTSFNSASLSFETNLPSKSYIEYGTTTAYGVRTPVTNEFHYLHLHYLTGLSAGTLYHYRINVDDEKGDLIRSADSLFATPSLDVSQIPIPGALSGPPYVLNQPGTTYYLTQDIIANARAITVKANDITLDLNGHTIIYDNARPIVLGTAWTDYFYSDSSTMGVYILYNTGFRIYNGTILQGANNGAGIIGIGFNPLFITPNPGGSRCEAAGLTIEYSGASINGVNADTSIYMHHNVITDKGTVIGDRAMGVRAAYSHNSTEDFHNNLIRRARQEGFRGNARSIRNNEVYVDSYSTNSFSIAPGANAILTGNRIFGTGYHAIGVGWASGITVAGNLIYMVGDAPSDRYPEYGLAASVNAIRLTQYAGSHVAIQSVRYDSNTIIVKGRNGTNYARGFELMADPSFRDIVVSNNVVKAEALDNETTSPTCIVAQGTQGVTWNPIYYNNNTLLSNNRLIEFGDAYAVGGNHHFRENTLSRFGTHSFKTLQIGYGALNTYGNLLIDTTVSGNASVDDVVFTGTGKLDYSVGHSLYLTARDQRGNAIEGATITVTDNSGITSRCVTDQTGAATLELLDFTWASSNGSVPVKSIHSNHTVIVNGYRVVPIDASLLLLRNASSNPLILTFVPVLAPPQHLRITGN